MNDPLKVKAMCRSPVATFMPERRQLKKHLTNKLPWLAVALCLLPQVAWAVEPPALGWQERAAERARALSQIQWTPVADTMPSRRGGYFEKGKQYTGAPYSSVRSVGRYIGFDISVRTFLAAVENPHSVLYTENLRGEVPNAAPYYGTVCSAFTSYALQCGIWEVSRRHGPEISQGIAQVQPQSASTVQVGDVIYTPHTTETGGSHVEIVTEVNRDANGQTTAVRVEESTSPTVKTTLYTVAKFDAHLASRNKRLFRIQNLDTWRADNRADSLRFPNYQADSATPSINRALVLDLGDWVPYQEGQPVKFNVMDRDARGVKSLVVQRSGATVDEIPVTQPGVHDRLFTDCGDYTAHVVHADGSASAACEFAVCDLDLRLPQSSVRLNEDWKVEFSSDNIQPIAIYLWSDADSYGRHPLFISADQRHQGSLTVPGKLLKKPGNLQVWVIGEHRLGRLKVRKDIAVVE
jgi:hypothetical protein